MQEYLTVELPAKPESAGRNRGGGPIRSRYDARIIVVRPAVVGNVTAFMRIASRLTGIGLVRPPEDAGGQRRGPSIPGGPVLFSGISAALAVSQEFHARCVATRVAVARRTGKSPRRMQAGPRPRP